MGQLFQNKLLNTLIKILIFDDKLFVLYHDLFSNEKIDIAYEHFLLNFNGNYFLLSVVILLMILNWTIESVKWKLLIDKLHPISWLDAIEGILFGVTFSLFTPSRIGEFGGRVFCLKHRSEGSYRFHHFGKYCSNCGQSFFWRTRTIGIFFFV